MVPQKICACYITTANFTPGGIEYLETLQNGKLKSSALDVWYNGAKLIDFLHKHGFHKTATIIQRYYIKPDVGAVQLWVPSGILTTFIIDVVQLS